MMGSSEGSLARGARVGLIGAVLCVALLAGSATAYQRPGRTERISVSRDGQIDHLPLEVQSTYPVITGDGRFVAFTNGANEMDPSSLPRTVNIYRYDRTKGKTIKVSLTDAGGAAVGVPFAVSIDPSVSDSGRFIAFTSNAVNLVPGDLNTYNDVFVRDLKRGTTELVSVTPSGRSGNEASFEASISGNGRYVAFTSGASDLTGNDPGSGNLEVYVRDLVKGTTELVSEGLDGQAGNGFGRHASLNRDGRFIAFSSDSSDLVEGDSNRQLDGDLPGSTGDGWDVFVRDIKTKKTERVSVGNDGREGAGPLANNAFTANRSDHAISADGRHVLFHSYAPNLVPNDSNRGPDAFVHDRKTGRTERVSVTSVGLQSGGLAAAISGDGRIVTFETAASDPSSNDTNLSLDVYAHDLASGATEPINLSNSGDWGDGQSSNPAVDATGRFIAFVGASSNLIPDDTNAADDIFVRDRGRALGVGGVGPGGGGVVEPEPECLIVLLGICIPSPGTAAVKQEREDEILDPGLDLIEARMSYRPASRDLYLRMDVREMDQVIQAVPVPGTLYGFRFELGGTRYEIRGERTVLGATLPGGAEFWLYRCQLSVCSPVAELEGSYGTVGHAVTVSLPIGLLGGSVLAKAAGLEAFTALGSVQAGVLHSIDRIELDV